MSTVDALLGRFRLQTGISVSKVTLSKALKRAGIRRFKPTEPPSATAKSCEQSQKPKRYGYQARHRPSVSKERYPNSLTDVEWELVKDLFEHKGEARYVQPSHAILDAQSTRSSPQGYDAGKKVKGRKRNLVVDTLGLVLAVSVCAASLQDRDAGTDTVAHAAEKYPTLQRLFVDTAYAGQWAKRVEQQHRIAVEVVRHPANRNVGRWQKADQQDGFPETLKARFAAMPGMSGRAV